MAKAKGNMFGSFGVAAETRAQEQQQIEATVTGKAAPARPVGCPRKRQDATTITLSLSMADKQKVKAYAFNHSTTVSDLFHAWINEHCTD